MNIRKRNGRTVPFDAKKIYLAMEKAFAGTGKCADAALLEQLTAQVWAQLNKAEQADQADHTACPSVEFIQDQVEQTLMASGHFETAKAYILYREQRSRQRQQRRQIAAAFDNPTPVEQLLTDFQREVGVNGYPMELLESKFSAFLKKGMDENARAAALILAANELTSQESPRWEQVAARLRLAMFQKEADLLAQGLGLHSFYEKVRYLTAENLYCTDILQNYSKQEMDALADCMVPERNLLFHSAGLELLLDRYVIRTRQGEPLETPQEMFLGIALHLAMPEKNDRSGWVKRFYDILSTLQVTMATPTLSNARKPCHQLSSCFIDTVPDSLDGIYRSVDNFAKVSKLGGGMGMYFGKVRATGSAIRGFPGAAGGVIRWIRLVNDTAVAVDQLGMRQGAVAVYLDAWHKDLPEFLALRTNNGDDRMKAHDVFPAVCYPDLFWRKAKDEINSDWYLMCPHEIETIKGYCLEDFWGDEWEKRYQACVDDPRISKRVIPVKELVRLIIKSAVETGTPFVFNRDTINRANPNPHQGMIYCSNLCTEIAQNMREIKLVSEQILTKDGETVIVTTTKPGDFVVCNLASLSLGRMDVDNDRALEEIIRCAVRALDNVIDLNLFPVPYARVNNLRYRPVGLGVSGYHHTLALHKIQWESQEHLDFADKLFEKINYFAIKASAENAREKGVYPLFDGSDWQTGAYFEKRGYVDEKWQTLRHAVQKNGLRNGYLMAIAPTGSTSILAGTTPGIDPVMSKFYLEEKKCGLMPRVAPDLSPSTYWFYKNAHHIDQSWSVRACGVRQRHIDQAQSMNLYITNDYTFRQILNLYLTAFEAGVKTVYYIRSKSLEVTECESCSS